MTITIYELNCFLYSYLKLNINFLEKLKKISPPTLVKVLGCHVVYFNSRYYNYHLASICSQIKIWMLVVYVLSLSVSFFHIFIAGHWRQIICADKSTEIINVYLQYRVFIHSNTFFIGIYVFLCLGILPYRAYFTRNMPLFMTLCRLRYYALGWSWCWLDFGLKKWLDFPTQIDQRPTGEGLNEPHYKTHLTKLSFSE